MTIFLDGASLAIEEVDLLGIIREAAKSRLFHACIFNLVAAFVLLAFQTSVSIVTNRVHSEDRDNCANIVLGWMTFKFILMTQTLKATRVELQNGEITEDDAEDPHMAMSVYTASIGSLALLRMLSRCFISRVRRNRMSGINPTYYNNLTPVLRTSMNALYLLVVVLVVKGYPLRLSYCLNIEILALYLEFFRGWLMHNAHMRSYGTRRRVGELVGSRGESEDYDAGGVAYDEIEGLQNKANRCNKRVDKIARCLQLAHLGLQLVLYIFIWRDLGFTYR